MESSTGAMPPQTSRAQPAQTSSNRSQKALSILSSLSMVAVGAGMLFSICPPLGCAFIAMGILGLSIIGIQALRSKYRSPIEQEDTRSNHSVREESEEEAEPEPRPYMPSNGIPKSILIAPKKEATNNRDEQTYINVYTSEIDDTEISVTSDIYQHLRIQDTPLSPEEQAQENNLIQDIQVLQSWIDNHDAGSYTIEQAKQCPSVSLESIEALEAAILENGIAIDISTVTLTEYISSALACIHESTLISPCPPIGSQEHLAQNKYAETLAKAKAKTRIDKEERNLESTQRLWQKEARGPGYYPEYLYDRQDRYNPHNGTRYPSILKSRAFPMEKLYPIPEDRPRQTKPKTVRFTESPAKNQRWIYAPKNTTKETQMGQIVSNTDEDSVHPSIPYHHLSKTLVKEPICRAQWQLDALTKCTLDIKELSERHGLIDDAVLCHEIYVSIGRLLKTAKKAIEIFQIQHQLCTDQWRKLSHEEQETWLMFLNQGYLSIDTHTQRILKHIQTLPNAERLAALLQ